METLIDRIVKILKRPRIVLGRQETIKLVVLARKWNLVKTGTRLNAVLDSHFEVYKQYDNV